MKMINMPKLNVGDVIYFHANNPSMEKSRDVQVTKVGKRWVYLSNRLRIRKTDWVADGGRFTSPGSCYPDREKFLKDQHRRNLYYKLQKELDYFNPIKEGVTAEDILKAAELLKIEII